MVSKSPEKKLGKNGNAENAGGFITATRVLLPEYAVLKRMQYQACLRLSAMTSAAQA